jgi:hypothetical protein
MKFGVAAAILQQPSPLIDGNGRIRIRASVLLTRENAVAVPATRPTLVLFPRYQLPTWQDRER